MTDARPAAGPGRVGRSGRRRLLHVRRLHRGLVPGQRGRARRAAAVPAAAAATRSSRSPSSTRPTGPRCWTGLLLSASIAMLGLLIAAVLGMAVGIAMSQARWVERSLYPYAVVLQCIPTLALVPVIGFWFDFGLASRLIVTVAIAVFPVISSTLFGLQSVERSQHDLLTLHRAGRLTRLVKLQLPTRDAGHPDRAAGGGHPGRGRCGGRGLLLPAGRRRDRRAHRPLPGPPAVRAAVRRGHPGLPARRRRVQRLRAAQPAGHRGLARVGGLRRTASEHADEEERVVETTQDGGAGAPGCSCCSRRPGAGRTPADGRRARRSPAS